MVRLLALAAAAAATALLHHGHVMQFIAAVYDGARRALPPRLRKHEAVLKASLVQVHFGDPAVHYEVWVQRKTRSIEIGLHFEGAREDNARHADVLAARAHEVQAQLGPEPELEQWTRSWTRLHETRAVAGKEWSPKRALTPALAAEVAQRFARYIQVLEPMVRKGAAAATRGRARRPGRAPRRAAAGGTASASAARRPRARSRRA